METTTEQRLSQAAPKRYRIVGESLLERSALPYAYDLRIHQLGGHIEAVALPRYSWSEVDHVEAAAIADAAMSENHIFKDGNWLPHTPSHQELLDRAARNQERSARRARTKVRRLCKDKGLTTMLTLTYRENMQDRDRMVRDFDVFMKRLRRVVPDVQYVCVFERQKRGAWHAHIAVPRVLSHYVHKGGLVKSYALLRSLWLAVVGADNGGIDVSRNKRVGRSAGKLAAYLAKYVTKSFGDFAEGGDSYRASGKRLPQAVIIRMNTIDRIEAAKAISELLLDEMAKAGELHCAFLDGGGYFVSLSP